MCTRLFPPVQRQARGSNKIRKSLLVRMFGGAVVRKSGGICRASKQGLLYLLKVFSGGVRIFQRKIKSYRRIYHGQHCKHAPTSRCAARSICRRQNATGTYFVVWVWIIDDVLDMPGVFQKTQQLSHHSTVVYDKLITSQGTGMTRTTSVCTPHMLLACKMSQPADGEQPRSPGDRRSAWHGTRRDYTSPSRSRGIELAAYTTTNCVFISTRCAIRAHSTPCLRTSGGVLVVERTRVAGVWNVTAAAHLFKQQSPSRIARVPSFVSCPLS